MRIDETNGLLAANRYNSRVEAVRSDMSKLASGRRIVRAADDSSTMVVNAKLRGQLAGLQQAARNVQDGISLLQIADGALGNIHTSMIRIKELAVQAANSGVFDAAARAAMHDEATSMLDDIDELATTTRFAGRALLDGTYSSELLMIGQDSASILNVSIASATTTALSVNSIDLAANAQGALASLDGALTSVSRQRGDIGALTARLESSLAVLQTSVESFVAADSRQTGTDMAQTSTHLRQNRIALIAGTLAMSQARSMSAQVLRIVV